MAITVRLFALAVVPRALTEDTDLYRALAENLTREGRFALGGKPTAFRPPGYPLLLVPGLLASGGRSWGIALTHIGLSVLLVGAVYELARAIGGLRPAIMAGLFVCLDPLLVWQSTQIMSETAAAALTSLTFLAAYWTVRTGKWQLSLLTGVVAGGVALTRSNLLPWAFVVPIILGLYSRRLARSSQEGQSRGQKAEAEPASAAPATVGNPCPRATSFPKVSGLFPKLSAAAFFPGLLGLALPLASWALRNRLTVGGWVVGTTHGGVTFYLANNDHFYDHLRSGGSPRDWEASQFQSEWIRRVAQAGLTNEMEIDKFAYQLAWETIRRRPREFSSSCLIRIGWLWSPRPGEHLTRNLPGASAVVVLVTCYYVALYVMALGGFLATIRAARDRAELRCVLFVGLALVLILSLVHAVYWSNVRMRAPATPFLALLSGVSVHALWERIRGAAVRRETSPLPRG